MAFDAASLLHSLFSQKRPPTGLLLSPSRQGRPCRQCRAASCRLAR
jgi:hypothetical protein